MARRQGLFWAGLAVLAAFYAGLVWHQHHAARREERLVSFRAKDVTEVRLTRGEVKTESGQYSTLFELKKEGNGFVFLHPYPGVAADSKAINNYLSVLERVPVRRRWDQKGNLSAFGVGPDSPQLVVGVGDRAVVLAAGKKNPVGSELFVFQHFGSSIDGEKDEGDMALVSMAAGALFQVQPMDFRARRVFPEGSVRRWMLERPGTPAVNAELINNQWMVSESSGPFFPTDRSAAHDPVQRIVRLRLSDFESLDKQFSLESAGLSSPVARLTVYLSTGPGTVLTLGQGQNAGALNAAVNGEIRGGVSTDFLEYWPSLAQLRKRRLVDFPLATVTRFTVERDDSLAVYEKQRGKWYRLGRERRPVDPRGVQAFFLALAKVEIDSFDFSASVESPQRRYVFYNSDSEQVMDMALGEKLDGKTPASFGAGRYRVFLSAEETDQWGF